MGRLGGEITSRQRPLKTWEYYTKAVGGGQRMIAWSVTKRTGSDRTSLERVRERGRERRAILQSFFTALRGRAREAVRRP